MKKILVLILLFCPLLLLSQQWHSYNNSEKTLKAKEKGNEIFAKIEKYIPEHRRPFIQRFAWLAIYDYNEYGVLASIKLSQGGLECGWGLIVDRGLKGNNYFSIKCREKKHVNGKCFILDDGGEMARFVKYNNAFDSFRGHTLHLKEHYTQLFKYKKYQDWALVLGKKYAVDPEYGAKINYLIRTYRLYEFDVKL